MGGSEVYGPATTLSNAFADICGLELHHGMALHATVFAEDAAGNVKALQSTAPLTIRRDRPHFTARLVPSALSLSPGDAGQLASYFTFVAGAKVVIEVSSADADASVSGCRVRLSRSTAIADAIAQSTLSITADGQHVAAFSDINGKLAKESDSAASTAEATTIAPVFSSFPCRYPVVVQTSCSFFLSWTALLRLVSHFAFFFFSKFQAGQPIRPLWLW